MVLKFDKMAGGRNNAPFERQGVPELHFKPRQMREQGLLVLYKLVSQFFGQLSSTNLAFECRKHLAMVDRLASELGVVQNEVPKLRLKEVFGDNLKFTNINIIVILVYKILIPPFLSYFITQLLQMKNKIYFEVSDSNGR